MNPMTRAEKLATINQAFEKGDVAKAQEIAKQAVADDADDAVKISDAEAYLQAAREGGDTQAINEAFEGLIQAHKDERNAKRTRPIMYKFGRPV
jgi:hypothetical protein